MSTHTLLRSTEIENKPVRKEVIKTSTREQIKDLNTLPLYDRSLIDYNKYGKHVGHAGVKHSIAVQATRGCPYRCFYCDVYKTTLHHFRRSVDNIFEEVKLLADIGVKRIEFIDDIFNVKAKDFKQFFKLVLKHKLKIGTHIICSGCRKPVSIADKKSYKYIEGISCPGCHDYLTDSQKSRFAMRQKQILLAKKQGKKYIFQKEFF